MLFAKGENATGRCRKVIAGTMLDIPLPGIQREKQDGSCLRSNLNHRSNFEDFWVGHPEKSLLKMSDSFAKPSKG